MLGLRSAVSEISGNTIFEHGGCFFLMLGLRSAVTEISGNTIFVEPQVAVPSSLSQVPCLQFAASSSLSKFPVPVPCLQFADPSSLPQFPAQFPPSSSPKFPVPSLLPPVPCPPLPCQVSPQRDFKAQPQLQKGRKPDGLSQRRIKATTRVRSFSPGRIRHSGVRSSNFFSVHSYNEQCRQGCERLTPQGRSLRHPSAHRGAKTGCPLTSRSAVAKIVLLRATARVCALGKSQRSRQMDFTSL